jgi:hypothetical protein
MGLQKKKSLKTSENKNKKGKKKAQIATSFKGSIGSSKSIKK